MAIKAPWSDKGAVQCLGEVCGANDNDAVCRVETVELDEELVECHFHVHLVLGVALASNGIDFVNKENARGVLLGGAKQVADAAGTHADKHLLKLGARGVEKRYARLAGNGTRQKSLARTGRADQEDTLGELPAEAGKCGRGAKVLCNFLELCLGLVASLDVVKLCGLIGCGLGLNLRVDTKGAADAAVFHEGHDAGEDEKGDAEGAECLPELRTDRGLGE
mmetsp:Transcript_451/g.1034  ORF Transcript_451/g.1034 Transcript_451/m.1034 type:complete len:221 (+) Transcript_451:1472-2134(+)